MVGSRVVAVGAVLTGMVAGACGSSGAGPAHTTGTTLATHEAARVVGTPSARHSTARYGTVPSWLPKAKVRVGRVVTATPSRPRLAIEGDTVDVRLPSGRAMMTSVGPSVPEEGRFPVPQTSPCRFVVTFAAIHGSIPIDARDFSFLSEHGQTRHVHVTLRDGGRPPARIRAGQPVSLAVRATLPTGNGQLRWAPAGSQPTASWDFDVEID